MCTYQAVRSLLAEKKYRAAAAIAGAMLEKNPEDLTAWYLTAKAVLGMGDRDCAVGNLKNLAESAANCGKPILSLGIIKEVENLGEDTDELLDKTAALYSAASDRMTEEETPPPPIYSLSQIPVWKEDDPNLLEKAKNAMAAAWGSILIAEGKSEKLPYVPIFSAIAPEDFKSLAKLMIRCEFNEGETIVEQDSQGDAVFVIVEGEVEVQRLHAGKSPDILAKLGPGAFFGEMALVSRSRRAAAVIARDRTVLLCADKANITALANKVLGVGDVLVAFCHQRMLQNLMRISPVLAPVPPAKRPEVIGAFTTDYRIKGSVLITEGRPGPGLFLIVSGEAIVQKREGDEILTIAELGPGDVFGEISLLLNKPSVATVIARENTAFLFLPASDFMTLTRSYPELLKGAYDIALSRELENNSILAGSAQSADELILI